MLINELNANANRLRFVEDQRSALEKELGTLRMSQVDSNNAISSMQMQHMELEVRPLSTVSSSCNFF